MWGMLSCDAHDLVRQLEAPGLRLRARRRMMQNGCGADGRMSGEWQLLEEIEGASAHCVRAVGRLKENGFEVAKLLGDTKHLVPGQTRSIWEHSQAVAT